MAVGWDVSHFYTIVETRTYMSGIKSQKLEGLFYKDEASKNQ